MKIKRFWAWPWELRSHEILGLNARNFFIQKVNSRALYPRVDDKLITKRICQEEQVPVPQTYGVIEYLGDVKQFLHIVENHPEFVVKPSRGSGGRGIIVISKNDGNRFETPNGNVFSFADIQYRISAILAGLYSLGGRPDKIIIEQLIKPHIIYEKLAVKGTPDIRIILCHNIPIMAMLRLPTQTSQGRANLHQGAIGVGIHLDKGETCGGVHKNRIVSHHPDTCEKIEDILIPQWEKILSMTSRLSRAIGLGYLGVDIILDGEQGPLVLEANARPGLAIQMANACGLRAKLSRCE